MKNPELKTMNVSELRTDHSHYSLFDLQASEFTIDNTKRRRHQTVHPLVVPVMDEYYVVTDIKFVLAARAAGKETMRVLLFDDIVREAEIWRMICEATEGLHIKGKWRQYKVFKSLHTFLTGEEGRELYDSLQGDNLR